MRKILGRNGGRTRLERTSADTQMPSDSSCVLEAQDHMTIKRLHTSTTNLIVPFMCRIHPVVQLRTLHVHEVSTAKTGNTENKTYETYKHSRQKRRAPAIASGSL